MTISLVGLTLHVAEELLEGTGGGDLAKFLVLFGEVVA